MAGGRDRSFQSGIRRRPYDAAVASRTFLELPGADHNDYEPLGGGGMIRAILRFVPPLT
jgi:hypothetical protein